MSDANSMPTDYRIVNMTGKNINIWNENTETFDSLPSHGNVWLKMDNVRVATINGTPVFESTCIDHTLPDKAPGVILVVSRLVANIFHDRDDLYISSKILKNSEGTLLGCIGISRPIVRGKF